MNNIKSHFKFTKGQRNGIFLLILLIAIFQCVYFFVDITPKEVMVDNRDIERFEKEVDSLRLAELEKRQSKIFPFNPNYISDYKGYTLGMSIEEIDRLLKYRSQNKWINSVKQFQEVTKVSDSLLETISQYFKFPDWVTNQKPKTATRAKYNNQPKSFEQKIDLNKATAIQLQTVNGIGKAFSERIIKFRNSFDGGFIADVQLQDVYGLTPEVIERIASQFTVKTPREIVKIKLNTATREQLVTIQHIDYELAFEIMDQRILREGFKSLDELQKVKGFPADKIEIIKLYLKLD